jgi:hypothetical protein
MGFWNDLLGVTGTSFKIGKAKATLDASGLTAARSFTLPDVGGTLGVPSLITASPSADQNDYAPTGFATASSLYLTPTVSIVITGFSSSGVSGGMQRCVRNDSTDKLVVLADDSSSSSAANRIKLSNSAHRGHYVILPGDAVVLEYDSGASRWKVVHDVVARLSRWVQRLFMPNVSAANGTTVGLSVTTAGITAVDAAGGGTYILNVPRFQVKTTTSAASAISNRMAGPHASVGDGAGRGGFFCRTRFGGEFNPGNAGASFIGLRASTVAIGDVNASTLVSIIGFGTDATQSTFRILKNDGAGTATATDLGANFPWNTTACYDSMIYCAPNGGALAWAIWRTDDLTIAPKVGYETTDIPTVALCWNMFVGNRAAAAAYGISLMSMECWTPD